MGKRGQKGHTKRIAVSKAIPLHDKKSKTWMADTNPGPHGKKSMPLVVLLREVLGVAATSKEVKVILMDRKVLVDGVVRTDDRFPVGLMDIVSMPSAGKHYRITVKRGKLQPEEIDEKEAGSKLLKVSGKSTVKGNKVSIALHDGRNLLADNNVKVGDTIEYELAGKKMAKLLKLGKGAKCIITDGKHSGAEVVVEEIYPNNEGRPSEALVSAGDASFRTLAGYLFVVGETATSPRQNEKGEKSAPEDKTEGLGGV